MVVIAMFAVIAIAALAIDVATWYQRHHQAQVAADSAALAAANYMASGGTAASATNTATTLASANGDSVPSGNVSVDTSADTVAVTATTSAPSLFGGVTPNIRAVAKAAWTAPTGSDCAVAGSTCYAFFAMDSTCTDNGFSLQGGNDTITGGVHSNSSFSTAGGNDTFTGAVTYQSGCTPTEQGGTDTFSSGSPAGGSTISSWPINYAVYFPACGGSACQSNGTPPYCTNSNFSSAQWNPALSSNQVYCDVGSGSGVNPNDPSTWNGALVFSGGGTATVTAIAGTVTFHGGGYTLTAYQHHLLAYAAGGNSGAPNICNPATSVCFTGGNDQFTGDVFDPKGTATLSGGNTTSIGFVEAQDIIVAGGNVTGDGPSTSGGGSPTTGKDYLIQ